MTRGRPAHGGQLIVLLGSLTTFGPLSIDMYLPGLPQLSRDLHTGASGGQLTLAACLVGLGVGQLVAGALSDSRGRRGVLLAGVALFAASSLLCAAVTSVAVLVVLRLVQGLAGAAGIVVSRAVVRDLYSGAAAARRFALILGVSGLAPILAPVLGGGLLRFTSWRGVFVALAGIGFVLLAAAARWLPETLPAANRQAGGARGAASAFLSLARDRHFIGYTGSCGLAFAAMFSYIAGSPFVLEEIYGLSAQQFGVAFAVNALGLVAAAQVSGWLVGRVGPARLLLGGLIGAAAAGVAVLAAITAEAGLHVLLPALFALLSSLGFVLPNATALALAGHPTAAGRASALVGLLQNGLGAIAAPVVGVAGTHSALPMGLLVAGTSCAALTVLLSSAGRTLMRVPSTT